MTGWGTVLPGNGGLAVGVIGEDWGFVLRRADLRPDAVFLAYHGKEIHPPEVAVFLPDWAALEWTRVPNSLLTRSESFGTDRGFQVTVRADGRSSKEHEAVVAAFLRFMAQAGP